MTQNSDQFGGLARPGVSLVMPMAGRGSRFAKDGVAQPKPLIQLEGRPFFWWACESVRRAVAVEELVFVVLAEHCRDHGIDDAIHRYYPQAQIVAIDDVTSGAAETACIGLGALSGERPVAVNDCDHAFRCAAMPEIVSAPWDEANGALMCFRSDSPAYSYARLGPDGRVSGTVEKQPVSPFAIAGCYWFADRSAPLDLFERYRESCPYDELFISGLFDLLIAEGGRVLKIECERHLSFGTPEELARVDRDMLASEFNWTDLA